MSTTATFVATASNAEFLKTILVSIISSGILVALVQHLLGRRQRKDQREKDRIERERQAEKDRKTEVHEQKLLATAQREAQRTALESADERYHMLHQDYQICRNGLSDVREATGLLIEIFDRFLVRLRPSRTGENYSATVTLGELGEARRAINEARRHLN